MSQEEFEDLFQSKLGLLSMLRDWYRTKKMYPHLNDLDNEIERLFCAKNIFDQYYLTNQVI